MPLFHYAARDGRGMRVEETLAFSSEGALRDYLRGRRLYVLHVAERRLPSLRPDLRRRPGLADLIVMVRQLRTMLRAGLPLVTGLESLAEQTLNPRLGETVREVSRSLSRGVPLAATLAEYPRIFPPLLVSLAAAGEESGRLPEALDEAGRQLELQVELRQKLLSAAVYPAFVLLSALATVLAMVLYVVPAFAQIYRDLQAPLPAITLSLVHAHAALSRFGWAAAAALLLLLVSLRRHVLTPRGRLRLDTLRLRLPFFGLLARKSAAASFAGSLAGLLDSGVPLLSALDTAAAVCGNEVVAAAVRGARESVRQGRPLSDALEAGGQLPLLLTRVVATAEQTGTLPAALREVSGAYVEEVEYGLRRAALLVEPVTVLAVGAVVGYILLALYYPLFNLGTLFMKGG